MKRIAVLTSGGDAPGMNACVRAVVRTAIYHELSVFGVDRGFTGLTQGGIREVSPRDVSNIIQQGGTVLRTSRCEAFFEREGRARAAAELEKRDIDGLIAIGGDGTMQGLDELQDEWTGAIIGAPGTIDNDMFGTDFTIGYDTAVNTALEATDRIRDTAASHDRVFLVEVMGRHAGFVALEVGVASGAEEVLIPETATDIDAIARRFEEGGKRGKLSSIVVVAEGDEAGSALAVSAELAKRAGVSTRVCILGHIQRGGRPTARDRVLATKIGAFAVKALLDGHAGVMAGEVAGKMVLTPVRDTWEKKKEVDRFLVDLIRVLSV